MAYTSKLNFTKGGTIAGNGAVRPGAQIKKAIEEIQSKSVTDLTSKAPGFEFERRGKNTWALVSKAASGGRQLIRVADPVRNDGASGSLEIKYENGQYVVYVTFPRVNRTVINGKEPEEAVNDLEERVAALETKVGELETTVAEQQQQIESLDNRLTNHWNHITALEEALLNISLTLAPEITNNSSGTGYILVVRGNLKIGTRYGTLNSGGGVDIESC